MTTTIKVTSHNYPALVQTFDWVWDEDKKAFKAEPILVREQVIKPEDGELTLYCTTSRYVQVTDIEYDDPRAASKVADAKQG